MQLHLLYAHVLFVKCVDVLPIDHKSIEIKKKFLLPLDYVAFPNFPHLKIEIIPVTYLYFKKLFSKLDNLKLMQVEML